MLQSIHGKFSGALTRTLGWQDADMVTVPINRCRHYCAFKYGSGTFNPYENYVVGLHQGQSLDDLRQRFEDFLMYFRPRGFGEMFNIELSRHIPLWIYPWHRGQEFSLDNGWLSDLDKVPDIITHFCEQGIKRSRIEEEYFWLERAYATISAHGYQPYSNSFAEAFELKNEGESVFIITDGNHRISALAALGYQEVKIKLSRRAQVNGKNYKEWPQVRLGTYSEQDALDIFNVYFVGVDGFRRSSQPARILEQG